MLNQILAVEKGLRSVTEKDGTVIQAMVRHLPKLAGISRTYQPLNDEGEKLPPESTLVQFSIEDALEAMRKTYRRLYDVTLTKEQANTEARADVVVDGQTLLADVPVTYLLFLEKQMVEMNAFINTLPTLDPASHWLKDENTGLHKTLPVETVRTKKVPRNWVKAPATDKHPAQVELYYEDVVVGTWSKTESSGALPVVRKTELQERAQILISAIKFAREKANSKQIEDQTAGEAVLGYLFG